MLSTEIQNKYGVKTKSSEKPVAATPSPKPPTPTSGETLDLNRLNLNDGSLSVTSVPKKPISTDAKKAIDSGKADPINIDEVKFRKPTFIETVDYGFNLDPRKGSNFLGGFFKDAIGGGISGIGSLKDRIVGGYLGQKEATKLGYNSLETDEKRKEEYRNILAASIAKEMDNDSTLDTYLRNIQKKAEEIGDFYYDKNNARKLEAGVNITDPSFVEKVGQAAPSMIPFVLAAIGTGGASAYVSGALNAPKIGSMINVAGKVSMVLTEASMEADQARQEVIDNGGTEEEALKAYDNTIGLNALLIGLTNKFDEIWDVDSIGGVKSLLKATSFSSIGEGFQEGVQQIISNYNTGRPIWSGVDEAFLIGAVLGGTVKGVTGAGGLSVESIKEELGAKGKDKVLEDILNNPEIPQEKKDAVKEILGNPSEETVQGIMQDAFQDGSVQNFVNVQQQEAERKTAEEEEILGLYQQQISAGIAPNVIFQEISNRVGVPVEDIQSTIKDLETRPQPKDSIAAIAEEMIRQTNPLVEKLETPTDKIGSLAQETLQEDEQTAPNVIKDMENDAEMQQDWENNYRVEYGDYNRQETYLRGQEQRYTQRAAKARVQAEISRIQAQKTALKEEYVKNNTEVTKADVEKAQKEKNPRKANRVLNQVGKEKTSKVVKNGKRVVRVNRITDTKKVTKKQLEKRAKLEGSFLDLKKDPTDLDTIDAIDKNQSDFVVENNIVKLSDVTESNPLDTTLKVGGLTFRFNTEDFQDFINGRSEEELRYFIKGDVVYLIDTSYGDWNRNSIVGKVEYFEPQKSTLFQTSSRNRFATQKDIENAFNNIPFLKYIPVQRVNEIKTPGGGSAWGSYFDGLIKYTENPKYGTIPHEAFHAFVDLILTPQEKTDLFTLARIEMAKDGYFPNLTEIQVEEYLAERFEDYYITKTEKSTFRKWFEKIIDALKSLVQSKKTINDYYNSVFDFETGKLLKPNMEMMPIRGDFVVAMNPQSIEEAREIIDGAEISQEEKNFLMNILDNPAYAKKTDWEAFLEEVGVRTLQVEGKIQNGRVALIERGNKEIGLPENTPGFAYLIKTDVEHGANTSHGFTDGADSIGWANVANTGDYYQVKEIQKISNRVLEPELENSNATPVQKEEILKLNKNYMNAFVIGLRDMAANDFKIIKFPTVEKAKLVNPQMSDEVAEKVYGKELSLALEKFTTAEFEDDGFGGNWVVYPSDAAKMIAHRFQTADVFEAIQQENLTTKILNRLGDRKTVSKTFVSDLAKMPDIKQKEKDLINEVLKGEPNTINVEEFKQKVRAELLPLYTNVVGGSSNGVSRSARYAGINLPEKLKVETKNYQEKVYESPVETTSGNVHFRDKSKSYFGHTRTEDVVGKMDRRVLEVQSDLYQRDRLDDSLRVDSEVQEVKSLEALRSLAQIGLDKGKTEEEVFDGMKRAKPNSLVGINSLYEVDQRIKLLNKQYKTEIDSAKKDLKYLENYTNPTAHFRMVREEINQAAKDGKKNILFPTGETAMKIEGLGDNTQWRRQSTYARNNYHRLTTDDLKVGANVNDGNTDWIITDVLGDGKFKAVPKRLYDDAFEAGGGGMDRMIDANRGQRLRDYQETFDISGKVDTNNPIYKFYQDTLGKYLKNTYKAELVKDKKGVEWYQIEITPEMAGRVEAFQRMSNEEDESFQIRKFLENKQWSSRNHFEYQKNKYKGVAVASGADKYGISDETVAWLSEKMNFNVSTIPTEKIVKELSQFKPKNKIDLYWGGDKEYLEHGKAQMHYTKEASIAQSFAFGRRDNPTVIKFKEVSPNDIIVDTTMIHSLLLKKLGIEEYKEEQEVVVSKNIWEMRDSYELQYTKEYTEFANNEKINWKKVAREQTKFQEKDVYDQMGKLLLDIKIKNREYSENQRFAQRVGEELGIILNNNANGVNYTPAVIAEELAKAQKTYDLDPKRATEMAIKGESPENIIDLAFGKYVLGRATQEGNIDAQRQILEKVSTTATEMGQNIAMLKGRVNLDDPNSFASKLLQQKKQLALRNWKPIFGKAKTIEEIVESQKKTHKKRANKLSEDLLKAKTMEMEAFFEAIKC